MNSNQTPPPTGREPSLSGDNASTNDVQLGGPKAVLHLTEMLAHEDEAVRTRAMLQLAAIGDDYALQMLENMLLDTRVARGGWNRVRRRAIIALGNLGHPAAFEPLMRAA